MLISTSATAYPFETSDLRKEFLHTNDIVGIYNDSTICFNKHTGEFWSVLKTKRFKVTRSEVNKMGLETSTFKKASK